MTCAMVCPCAGPVISVRRISMSKVPCTISPLGCEFSTIDSLHSNVYGNIAYSTRQSMGSAFFQLDELSAGHLRLNFSHRVHDGVRALGRNVMPAVFDELAFPAAGKPRQAQL